MYTSQFFLKIILGMLAVSSIAITIVYHINNQKLNLQLKQRDNLIEKQLSDMSKLSEMKSYNDSLLIQNFKEGNIIIENEEVSPLELLELLKRKIDENQKYKNQIQQLNLNDSIKEKDKTVLENDESDYYDMDSNEMYYHDHLVINPPVDDLNINLFERDKILQIMHKYKNLYISYGYDKKTNKILLTNDTLKIDMIYNFYKDTYHENPRYSLRLYSKDSVL